MPNKKPKHHRHLTPVQRRLRAEERRKARLAAAKKEEHQQHVKERARQEERAKVNKLGLLRPGQRQARVKKIKHNQALSNKAQHTRIQRVHKSADTANAHAVRRLMHLSPQERALRRRKIQQDQHLTEAQERLRMQRLRHSGPIGKLPKGAPPSRVPPLGPDAAENFEDLLSGDQLNAFRHIQLEFERMGLGHGLAKEVYHAIVNGVTNIDQILDLVRQSDVYKARFPGMARRDPNLPPLSEGEYIDIEKQYRWVMETAGLPQGFFDSPDDFAGFIGNDVGPTEFQGRVDVASRVAQSVDPFQRNMLAQYYGLGTGELTAFFLSQQRALPILQRQVEASGIAHYANLAGMGQNKDMPDWEDMIGYGVTEEEARQKYGTAGQRRKGLDQYDAIYGEHYSNTDAEKDIFIDDPDATRKREKIVRAETGTWSGSSRGITGAGSKKFSY